MAALPENFYNFHPGSHVGQGVEAGIDYIAAALKNALRHDYPVTVLLETMAGKGSEVGGIIVAYITILVLGASFSLVPASLWPSVPKLVDEKIIGSAYALIFWIQNIGLWLFPLLIGKVLDATNKGVTNQDQLDYTAPLVMLAGLGVAALILGLVLKVVDKKKGLGLEEPNIK